MHFSYNYQMRHFATWQIFLFSESLMHSLSPQVGRQSCAQFAPTDQVPKCLQAKQLTPINSSRIRKTNRFLLPNSCHNLYMHTYGIILMKTITGTWGCLSYTKGLKKETGTFVWSNLLTWRSHSGVRKMLLLDKTICYSLYYNQ